MTISALYDDYTKDGIDLIEIPEFQPCEGCGEMTEVDDMSLDGYCEECADGYMPPRRLSDVGLGVWDFV
jgi:hypothetical protein